MKRRLHTLLLGLFRRARARRDKAPATRHRQARSSSAPTRSSSSPRTWTRCKEPVEAARHPFEEVPRPRPGDREDRAELRGQGRGLPGDEVVGETPPSPEGRASPSAAEAAGARRITGIRLTKPDDPDKLKALVAKMNAGPPLSPSVMKKLSDGWRAPFQERSTCCSRAAARRCRTSTRYTDALGKLPDDALAKVYVNGAQLSNARSASRFGRTRACSTAGLDSSGRGPERRGRRGSA